MTEIIEQIQKKAAIKEALGKYRPALISLFQEVVKVSTEVQPQCGIKVVNFNNDVILDLPPRMRGVLMAEFEVWMDRKGSDFLTGDALNGIGLDITSTRVEDAVYLTITDVNTYYQIEEVVTYADLAPFLQAGLDFHHGAPTFFIPRS